MGKMLLIWGGATCVSCNSIQLAVAAGYEVVASASPKNFDLLKKLGASQLFDDNSRSVVEDLAAFFQGKTSAGTLDCIGPADIQGTVLDVVSKIGEGFKFVATVKPAIPTPEGVRSKHIFASTIQMNHVGKGVYEDFLPAALAAGTFVPAPEPNVVGKGLESIQAAVDIQRKGVSASKIVVTL
jgi:NADPH:quinone reductase-like Zn-dependent oxidoreductase